MLVTQGLAALLLAPLRSGTAQPVQDTQSWIAHALAYFNVIMFWLLCRVFSTPASILLALWLERSN